MSSSTSLGSVASVAGAALAAPPLPKRTRARLRALVERAGHETRLAILDGDHDPGAVAEALSAAGVETVLQSTSAARAAGPAASLVRAALSRLAERRRTPSFDQGALACAAGCHALWYEHPRHASPVGLVDVRRARDRRASFLHAIECLLEDAAGGRPLGVVVSMRGSDAETAELLRHLATRRRDGASAPLIVVACGAGVSRLTAIPGATWLQVEPLDVDGLRAWLSSPEVLQSLLAHTGGHVEALERVLRGLPADPEGFATRALGDAGSRVRSLLEALSIMGRHCAVEELARVAELDGIDEQDLAALCRSPLLETRSAGAVRSVAFVREREQEFVSRSIDATRRAALERRAGQACRGVDDAAAVRHFLRGGDAEAALEAARDATSALCARHAFEAAVELLEEVRHGLPADAGLSTRALLSDLAWTAGDPQGAIEHARVLAAADPLDPSVHLRVGRLELGRGHLQSAKRALDAAAKLVSQDHALHLDVDAERADLAYRCGDTELAQSLGSDVLARAQKAERRDVLLSARNTVAKAHLAARGLDEAEALLTENLAAAREHGSARHAWQATSNLGIAALTRQQYPRARALFEESAALASRQGAAFDWAVAVENLAVLDHILGRFGDALSRYREAASLLAALNDGELLGRVRYNLADLHLTLGDPYRARTLANEARETAAAHGHEAVLAASALVLARVELELGELPRARTLLERLVGQGREPARNGREARVVLARVCTAEGHYGEAEALLAAIEPEGNARVEVALEYARAELALARGADAVPRARIALDAAERAGRDRVILSALLILARALSRAGMGSAAERALERANTLEQALVGELPAELRDLFAERAERRALASLEGAHSEPPPRLVPQANTGTRPLIGRSAAMRQVHTWIDRVGPTEGQVLITGESGTGKELAAEALHRASARRDGPFVALNCAALVETLLLSELFGHERGAFTGATATRKGRFELADGGTLFLDEVGEVTPRTQAALLRALQEKTFERVGGTRSLRVDVRIIAATNRDLPDLVRSGHFREDLYYRLRGLEIQMPALRERHGDIPLLAAELLTRVAKEMGGAPKRLSEDAMALLGAHRWPGNVRELENVLRSAALLCSSSVIEASDLSSLRAEVERGGEGQGETDLVAQVYDRIRNGESSIYDMRRELEVACIERALNESHGNIAKAASFLGMKRPRLSQLVKEHGLKTKETN